MIPHHLSRLRAWGCTAGTAWLSHVYRKSVLYFVFTANGQIARGRGMGWSFYHRKNKNAKKKFERIGAHFRPLLFHHSSSGKRAAPAVLPHTKRRWLNSLLTLKASPPSRYRVVGEGWKAAHVEHTTKKKKKMLLLFHCVARRVCACKDRVW